MAFKFEELKVWHKAADLTVEVDKLTKQFPREETYVLSAQIKRAADSVALNIAEGCTGQSNAEFSKFLGYAIRSAVEVVSCLFPARKRSLLTDEEQFDLLYGEYETLTIMIQALRKTLN